MAKRKNFNYFLILREKTLRRSCAKGLSPFLGAIKLISQQTAERLKRKRNGRAFIVLEGTVIGKIEIVIANSEVNFVNT